MIVNLPPNLEAMVRRKVESGPYAEAGDVVLDALRLMDERDRRLQALRDAVAVGLAQADRGETVEYTPRLLDEIDRAASQKARNGEAPNSDVVP